MKRSLQLPALSGSYSPSQWRIILGEERVQQVIAAAGSGKTRTVLGVVEYQLKSGRCEEKPLLLLSFSRKAAGELRERLEEGLRHRVEISTFHSFCYRHLARLHPRFREEEPRLMDEEEKRQFYEARFREAKDVVGGIPFSLLWRERELVRPHFPALFRALDEEFRLYKETNGVLEYGDLMEMMVGALEAGESWTESLRSRYHMIIVDEFQDTDPRQLRFLTLMEFQRLMVVGDDWQAIYGFRGATVRPFLEFRKTFPGAQRYRLARNYRSTSAIIRLGSRIIAHSRRQLRKSVKGERQEAGGLFRLELKSGQEESLHDYLFGGTEYRILTRSNRRRKRWIEAGFPEERVMTIHKSKGLEFPVVFLDTVGGWYTLQECYGSPLWSRFFSRRDERRRLEIRDEEIRIVYVGVSRAMRTLVLLLPEGEKSQWHRELFGSAGRELRKGELEASGE